MTANVDYEDAAWSGQTTVDYRPEHGFTVGLAHDFDARDVLRGQGEVPSREAPLARHNHEIRLEFGWRAANRYAFETGLALDTDPGSAPRGWFGGGEGALHAVLVIDR